MSGLRRLERRALYHNPSAIEMSFIMVARIENETDLAGMRSAGKKAATGSGYDRPPCATWRNNRRPEPNLPRLHC